VVPPARRAWWISAYGTIVLVTRVRAPELRGRGWLNTGGRELELKDFRGKILLLDFWSSLL
jgi:hypothetical protein